MTGGTFRKLREQPLTVPCTGCRVPAGAVCLNRKVTPVLELGHAPAHVMRLWDGGAWSRPGTRGVA